MIKKQISVVVLDAVNGCSYIGKSERVTAHTDGIMYNNIVYTITSPMVIKTSALAYNEDTYEGYKESLGALLSDTLSRGSFGTGKGSCKLSLDKIVAEHRLEVEVESWE